MKPNFIKTAACAAALAFSLAALCGCVKSENERKQINYLSQLTAKNGSIVDETDGEVILRGVNAGGLFVTEHWMTGFTYGSSPSNDYRSLTQTFINRFGEEKTKQLWEEYRQSWWSEEDFAICADMGINVIRLPFSYMNIDWAAVTDYDKAGINYDFSAIDDFVQTAASYGMYTILDLHGAYGSQNGQDHSGEIIEKAEDVHFYSDARMKELTVKLWSEIARHYKDNTNVAGYDILNEPGEKAGLTTEVHWRFFDEVYKAIRAEDDKHIVIFESCWDGKNLPPASRYGWKNCMYSFHHYAGDKLSYENYCRSWDSKIKEVENCGFGLPLQMGEFTNYGVAEQWEYALGLLNSRGWHWASWTYKIWGKMPWGVINIRGSAEEKVSADKDGYEEILTKFRRLRTSEGERYTFDGGVTLEGIITRYSSNSNIEK